MLCILIYKFFNDQYYDNFNVDNLFFCLEAYSEFMHINKIKFMIVEMDFLDES